MNDIAQLLINSSGAAFVSGMFLWYLSKRDGIIDTYLEEHNRTTRELAKQLEHFANVIEGQKEMLGEQSEMLKTLYGENLKKLKTIRTYERAANKE